MVNVIEPVWTTLLPMTRSIQYLVHWYIAETLPPDIETAVGPPPDSKEYQEPPAYPTDLSLVTRLASEPEGYEPPRYENTGVDDDEAQFTSHLVSLEKANQLLGDTAQGAVINAGWTAIQARLKAEGYRS